MSDKRYIVILTRCDCHPETCRCDPYTIYDTKEKEKFTTAYNKSTAQKVADALNK